MEKQTIMWFILGSIFLAALVLISSSEIQNPSKNLPYTSSFTKAVCNESNLCQDYEITCKNSTQIRFQATGFTVQFPEDWVDKRTKQEINKNC